MADRSSEELSVVSRPSEPMLPGSEKEFHCCKETFSVIRLRRTIRILTIVAALQAVIQLVAVLAIIGIRHPSFGADNVPFSPARSLLRDEIKVFSDGLENLTVYQGNSTEAETAWEDLYLGTTLRLSRAEALLLPNRTWPLANDEGYYIAQLDVFHQLHCLNSIRRLMAGEQHIGYTPEHISHCFDSIRQHIMCNIDVSVIVWQWDFKEGAAIPAFTHPHKCSNFEAIHRWARKNKIRPGSFDERIFVENDLPEPAIIY